MTARRDALLGAARIVTAVRDAALAVPGALGTVSRLDVEPGSPSVIPGRAELIVDLRHPELRELERLEVDVRRLIEEIADQAVLDVEIDTFLRVAPVAFDQSCVEAIRAAARRLSYPAMEVVSGAGHDAFSLASRMPAAMIFIPCRDGVSHHPAEHAELEHVRAGCDVLLHAVLEKAGLASDAT